MKKKDLLIIFVKNPERGKVKTRLAEAVGKDEALAIYRFLLQLTREATQPLDMDRQVWYSGFIPENDAWSRDGFEQRRQKGDDLGERMYGAFREAFEAGFQKVVIIGSDCAQMSPKLIMEAFERLGDRDVVIGPSEDGGYYLLGMSRLIPELFEGKTWSSERVYRQTLSDVGRLNLTLATLPVLNDIDTKEDWLEVKNRN